MSQPRTTQSQRRSFRKRLLFLAAALALVAGCNTAGYYQQAAVGQYQILSRQELIQSVLARPDTTPRLRKQLQLVLDVREFAEHELHLKTEGHYSHYADLGRRYVVWNVYAAPEFSLEPKKWWYPVVGSLNYRGFFSEKDAGDCATRLEKQGYDVYVGGVDAYSTLGWFKDPVLNTFIHHDPPDLAEILFHELAHQRVFAKGDTDFNEAFATSVGEEGVRRWLAGAGDTKMRADYDMELRRKDQFVALILKAREELKEVYGEESAHAPRTRARPGSESLVAAKRIEKQKVLADLRVRYEQLKSEWGGYAGYDAWFKRPLNNAQLNTVAAYYTLVPAFKQLLAQNNGDLEKFYAEAKAVAALNKDQRQQRMVSLAKSPANRVAVTLPSGSAGRSR